MIAALEAAYAAARVMTPRAFNRAKSKPPFIYALHDIACRSGQLMAVDRDYRILGGEGFDYAAPGFAHLRIADVPAVRALARNITEYGYAGRGPIYYFLGYGDTRDVYCARLLALIEALGGRHE
jgi:hypothetical protein